MTAMEQKEESRYGKLFKTILISGGALLINSLISFCLVPVISNTVGTEAYGFVSMAKNFEQYAMILTAALNAFAVRYIAIRYHEDNLEQANIYFSSTFFGDAFLATLLFVVALVCIFFLDSIFQISPELVTDVKLLFLFIFVNFWIVTMTTAFTSTAHIKNKLDVAGIFKVMAYLSEAMLLVGCYSFLKPAVYYVGAGRALQAVVLAIGAIWIWRRYAKELVIKTRFFSTHSVQNLLSNGIWTSMNSLGGVLNDGLDLWICNLMLTPLGMGQLAIAKTFHSFFNGIFSVISQSFEPLFLKSYATGEIGTLMKELKLSMKVSGMLSNILFAGFVALGVSFYRLWIPKEDIMLVYGLTIISNLATVPSGPMFPLYYIYVLTAKNRFPTIVTIFGGIFNVSAMYILLSTTSLGNYAILWTSVIVSVVIAFISNPLYMAHVLKQPWHTFYPGMILNIVSCAIMTALFYGLSKLYQPSSWLMLILSAIALFFIGASLHLTVVCNKEERHRIIQMLMRKKNLE